MSIVIVIYILVPVVAILFSLWYRRNRLQKKDDSIPNGFVQTDEIFIDPTTGIRQRVWYNSKTGERFYETIHITK